MVNSYVKQNSNQFEESMQLKESPGEKKMSKTSMNWQTPAFNCQKVGTPEDFQDLMEASANCEEVQEDIQVFDEQSLGDVKDDRIMNSYGQGTIEEEIKTSNNYYLGETMSK